MRNMTTESLLSYLDAGCEAAWRAAAVLDEWRPRFQTREKGRFDLVTDADLASQRVIRGFLKERFPDHDFLGEKRAPAKPDPARARRRPGSSIRLTAPPTMCT